jgi:hypothetical protein
VPIAELAKRFGKSSASIARARQRRRADLLLTIPITSVHLPTFDLADAESVILGAPAVSGDLGALLPTHDVLGLLEAAKLLPVDEGDETTEHALIAGYNFLKRRARSDLGRLPRWPSGPAIDRIETDLRWAARLKRRLCNLALPAAIRRIELNLHRPLNTQPAERISDLLRRAVGVISTIIEPLDPNQGQRLLRRASYAVDRALSLPGALPGAETTAGRAAARHEPGSIALDDLFDALTPWHDLLELRRAQIERLGQLDPQRAELLRLRYGLGSTPPQTLQETADHLGLTLMAVRRAQLAAERALRRVASAVDGAN